MNHFVMNGCFEIKCCWVKGFLFYNKTLNNRIFLTLRGCKPLFKIETLDHHSNSVNGKFDITELYPIFLKQKLVLNEYTFRRIL